VEQLYCPANRKLNVQTRKVEHTDDPCILPPRAGYESLENQLYRVEVQKGGSLADATFKWSRDNASVETKIEGIEGRVLTVADTGKDEVLGFQAGQWVEIIDEESVLKSSPNQLTRIADESGGKITVSTAIMLNRNIGKLKLRRWDQSVPAAGVDGLPATAAWIDLEDGIQVSFSEGTYRAGDYWLIPARTATGEVEWPYEIPNLSPTPQSPLGINHNYCKLSLLKVESGTITLSDCRPLFRH
jgi:hypothetical protein